MKKKTFLFYLFSFFFLLFLITLDVVSVKNYVSDPDRIRRNLKRRLGDNFRFNRSSFDLLDGLKLHHFQLFAGTEKNRNVIFQAPTLHISFDVLDSLQGQFKPSLIRASEPNILLSRNQNGNWNINQFLSTLPSSPDLKSTNIPTISMTGGKCLIRSPHLLKKKQVVSLQDFSLEARSLQNNENILFMGEGSNQQFGLFQLQGTLKNRQLSFSIHGEHIKINPITVKQLSPQIQQYWKKLNLRGIAKLDFHATFHPFSKNLIPTSEKDVSQWRIMLRPQRMKGEFNNFPYPLQNLTGTIEFTPDRINIVGLTAKTGKKRIRIGGTITGYGPESSTDLYVHARNIPLNQQLLRHLSQETRAFVSDLQYEGSFNASAQLVRRSGRDKFQYEIRVHPQHGKLQYKPFPYPFRNVTGTVRLRNNRIRIVQLRGIPDTNHSLPKDAHAILRGTFQSGLQLASLPEKPANPTEHTDRHEELPAASSPAHHTFQLTLNGHRIPLNNTLKSVLPGQVRRVWDRLSPSGNGNVTWNMSRSGRDQTLQHDIQATVNSGKFIPDFLKTPVKNVSGELVYRGDEIKFKNATGFWKSGRLQLRNGSIKLNRKDERPATFVFNINGKNIPVCRELRGWLSGNISQGMTEWIETQGSFDFTGQFNRLKKHKTGEFNYYVSSDFSNLKTSNPFSLSEIEGKINVGGKKELHSGSRNSTAGQSTEERSKQNQQKTYVHVTSGNLMLSDFRANRFPIQEITCNFSHPGSGRLEIRNLRGKLFDGTLSKGKINYKTESKKFSMSGRFDNINIARLIQHTKFRKRELKGQLGGSFQLSGQTSNPDSWTGKGILRTRKSKLWEIPLFLSVFTTLSLKKQEPFNRGTVRFSVKNRTVTVNRMKFSSTDATLLGKGTVQFDGRMLINLKTKFSNSWLPDVPVFSNILDTVTDNLYTLQATGTFERPEVNVKPLPFLFGDELEENKQKD